MRPWVSTHDVIGAVVALALEPVGQHLDLARLQVGAHQPATAGRAELGALTTDQPAGSVKRVAVGAPAIFTKYRESAVGGHSVDAIADNVAEIKGAVGVKRRSLEQAGSGGDRGAGVARQQAGGNTRSKKGAARAIMTGATASERLLLQQLRKFYRSLLRDDIIFQTADGARDAEAAHHTIAIFQGHPAHQENAPSARAEAG